MEPDPGILLMDLDPTSFLSDFKDAKKLVFFVFFLITYPQAHYLQSSKLKDPDPAKKYADSADPVP